ncbi:MAG: lysophospholipid acyltransferase family protein [Acidobacteriaceae bacterium]
MKLLPTLAQWLLPPLISLLCRTLRYEYHLNPSGLDEPRGDAAIYCFWHRSVIPACWPWRNKGIRVLTSRSADGEIIARVIERFGFHAIRGSSSRGALTGLRMLERELHEGHMVAFTIDGPRGPLYVAKPGPVLLAKLTGARIVCFYVAVERAWVLHSWDKFVIPKPFSRAFIRSAPPLYVPRDADDSTLSAAHSEMQCLLDRVRVQAEQDVASSSQQ